MEEKQQLGKSIDFITILKAFKSVIINKMINLNDPFDINYPKHICSKAIKEFSKDLNLA